MKKVLSLLLTTAMLCGAAGAYHISGGQMQTAPAAVQTDLAGQFDTLGLDAPKVTGSSGTSFTAALGDRITLFGSGSETGTKLIAARLDTSNRQAAQSASTDFGAACGAILSLVAPGTSSATANAALKLDSATPSTDGTDNLRTFFANNALFTYEVRPESVRFTALAYPDKAEGIQLVVNDSFLSLDVQPRIVNGRTLVPLRGIFEQLGAVVGWDQATQTATVTRGESVVRVTIGSTSATVDGETLTLDVPAQLSQPSGKASTLVPVRFISESLGALVGWNDSPQTVVIRA